MVKPFKILLSGLIALVLLTIIALYSLPFIIDPNSFKPEITAAIKNRLGRELILEGDLKFTPFPSPGISTGKMILGNAPGYSDKPFATLEESHFAIKLLPLLTQRIEISHIILKGLVLNLTRNSQGLGNWQDLIDSKEADSPSPSTGNSGEQRKTGAPAFAIGGITVEDAHVIWDNRQTGAYWEVKDFNLNYPFIIFDKAAVIEASWQIINPKAKRVASIMLNTELVINRQLDTFILSNSKMQITPVGENFQDKSLTATLAVAGITLNKAQQTVKVSGLQLNSDDMNIAAEITGDHIIDQPSFQGPVVIAPFNPAKTLKHWNITLPAMQDANALNKLAVDFNLQGTADSVSLQNLKATLDDSRLEGSAHIQDFTLPVIAFKLAIDTLDADRYLPPALKIDKPITSPAMALAAAVSALPGETLRKMDANGDLSIDSLKINGLTMQDIHLNLNTKNGIVSMQQGINQLYQGSYTGTLNMNMHSKKPSLTLNEKITDVHIEPLLKDFNGTARMTGTINALSQLQGQGFTVREFKSSLRGQISFSGKNVRIKGFDLQKIIDNGKTLQSGPLLSAVEDQTLFSEISGTASISNGLLKNHDLIAKNAQMHINGNGAANLNSKQLDYKINARFLKTPATASAPEQFHDTPVTIAVKGAFSKPIYLIDMAALLTDKNKAKIEKFLDKLDKKLGPEIDDLLKNLF